MACLSFVASQSDYSRYVNPLIDSSGPLPGLAFGGGDIFVGAARPFGVVKVGIDTYEDNITLSTLNGDYTPEGRVTAISMMHESKPEEGITFPFWLADFPQVVQVAIQSTAWFLKCHSQM